MTKYFSWNDRSGDYIAVTYTTGNGNQTISITSDPNETGVVRTRTIYVKTSELDRQTITMTMTITQNPTLQNI